MISPHQTPSGATAELQPGRGLDEDGVQEGLPDGGAHQPILLPQVDLLVLQEVLLLCEALVALATPVGPLSSVDPLVPDQIRGVAEALATVQASQGAAASPRVQPLVGDEALLLGEALGAPVALVRPLPPVALLVLPIGRLEVEGFHTLGAAVRLLSCRPPGQVLEVVTLLEGFLTRHRGVGSPSRVDALMQGELLFVSEALLALWPVAALRGVTLLVEQEALLQPEGLPTLGAYQRLFTWAVTLV